MASASASASASTPISAVQTTITSSSSQESAIRNITNNLITTISSALSKTRPWPEIIDRSAFSKPESFSDATLRLRKNYSYFRLNYLIIITASLALSLITHPFSLLTLISLLASWIFLYILRPANSPPLVFFGRTHSDREIVGILSVLTVVVIFLTSVGSIIVSALLAGIAVVCIHGAFRMPEDLFLDEQEAGTTVGFLSLLSGVASNTASPAVVAAARV